MGILDRLKRKKKEDSKIIEVPEEWVKGKQLKKTTGTNGVIQLEIKKHHKIRVPGLRTGKRVLAAVMLIVNFFISQAALLSAPAIRPLFWLFILNSFIIIDYLWKTRHREEVRV